MSAVGRRTKSHGGHRVTQAGNGPSGARKTRGSRGCPPFLGLPRSAERGGTGLERGAETTKETAISETGGAESGALADQDSDLAEVVRRWGSLPSEAKAAILAIVKSGVARVT